MQFNSIDFLIYFPVAALFYFLLPQKVKWIWLLSCSVYFYMCWKALYILLIGFSIAVTYAGALLMARWKKRTAWARGVLAVTLAANFAVLFLFKYYGFFLSAVQPLFGQQLALPALSLALPVGISFYTFQALGYAIDVYRGTLCPERNLLRYALFVCFFPQLVAGPIERAGSLLPQFYEHHRFDLGRMKRGLLLMGWGFFQKLVIADRLALLVDGVYDGYAAASGSMLALATVFFSFQIYCDFASYSNIAIGAAGIMGFRLMQNFNAPYLACSVKDFWRRWHISLSTWFQDYLYIPLGGSRRGTARTCLNLMAVFLVSGLWHGAAWPFVIWGAVHGLLQMTQVLYARLRAAVGRSPHTGSRAAIMLKRLATFLIVCLTWIFFRCETLEQAGVVFIRIFTQWDMADLSFAALEGFGMDAADLIVGLVALGILAAVDILSQKRDLRAAVLGMPWPAQWAFGLGLIAAIAVFGVYGPAYQAAPFIYFQF